MLSTKSLEIKNLVSFIQSINQKPRIFNFRKISKKGFLIADIKLEL